jgi:soluble lytic murein transglycosylase-like protein
LIAAAAALFLTGSVLAMAAEAPHFPESASLPPPGTIPDQQPGPVRSLPQPLPQTDAWRYSRIFALQAHGDWRGADRLISDLKDTRLLGHVLAQRYLSAGYKMRFGEAQDWLRRFADHPDAADLRAVAVKKWPKLASQLPQPLFQDALKRKARVSDESDSRYWGRGLKAWRQDDMATAARQFEAMATDKASSDWERSAGAYWTARAHLRNHQPELVNQWLKAAAEYPRTFYGQLARKRLGLDIVLAPATSGLSAAGATALLQSKMGQRVLALVQIGENERAADELANLPVEKDAALRSAVIAVSEMMQLPQLTSMLLAASEATGTGDLEAALYPVPKWQPKGGFTIDRALIYAIMRQESGFNPKAKSSAGALGLMQLMPTTASLLAGKHGKYRGAGRKHLYDPVLNVTLGEKYIDQLLDDPQVGGDLIKLAIAYNAGPAVLPRWEARAKAGGDPLLFIAALPVRQTRIFVERVLTNYWIYRQRLGQDTAASLGALAAGDWPDYAHQDGMLATK